MKGFGTPFIAKWQLKRIPMFRFAFMLSAIVAVSTSVASAAVVNEGFEGVATSGVRVLGGAELSSVKPFSGLQHARVTTALLQIEMEMSLVDGSSSVLISCFADPRGKTTTLHFSNGELTRDVVLDHTLIGYRQVAVMLPAAGLSKKYTVTASGNNGHFLLDELKAESLDAPLCERPEPTQILSNYNGVQRDMFRSLELDGKGLLSGEAITVDGYALQTEKISAVEDAVLLLDVQPEDANANYGYAVWVDADRDGSFAADERVAMTSAVGNLRLPVVTAGLIAGTYGVRVRMLDQQSNDLSDAYTGKTWGQTIDLFLELSSDADSKPCRCTQPDYYLDLSGKQLKSLEGAPAGMYIKVSEACSEKTMVVW